MKTNTKNKTSTLDKLYNATQPVKVKMHRMTFKRKIQYVTKWLFRRILITLGYSLVVFSIGANFGYRVVPPQVIINTEAKEIPVETIVTEQVVASIDEIKVPDNLPDEYKVMAEIIKQSLENPNVETYDALRIAWCESRFNPRAQSSISTAGGVYQFIDKTHEAYVGGSKYDYKRNIAGFMELYPKHPDWWECEHLTK